MTNIYLNDETKDLLKKIRKLEPNFNLSNFIQTAISNYTGEGIESIDKLNKMIGDNKVKIDFINNEIAYLENKMISIKEKQSVMDIERRREIEATKRQAKLSEIMKSIDTRDKNGEYRLGLKEGKWNSITEYGEYKLKEKEMQNNE